MKICIITVYNTENCGSFLQAKSLADKIAEMGNDVYFLKRDLKDTPNSLKRHIIEIMKRLAKLNFAGVKNEISMYKGYRNAQKCFAEITPNDPIYNEIDYFVFGSDTIWNIQEPYFAKNIGTYFGKNTDGKKIAYAPSVGGTELKVFEKNSKVLAPVINDFDALSARDDATKEMIASLTGKYATPVCDPTLLLTKANFNQSIADKPTLENAPIFAYYFGHMSKERIAEIRDFAKQQNKQIISMNRVCRWADKTIPFEPYTFLQYYRDSAYVLTNTFHGTIFSLLYHKRFANFGSEKAKVRNLLEKTGLTAQFVNDKNTVGDVLKQDIDYNTVDAIIDNMRNKSIQYLKDNLK